MVLGSFLAAAAADVSACGDKFLRIGRSARISYAGLHKAAILLYVPEATPSRIKAFENALRSAGHRPLAVRDLNAFSTAVASGRYDIVIARLSDAPRLSEVASVAPSGPSLLPILPNGSKDAIAAASREFPHYLQNGAPRDEALEEIDAVMESRLTRP